MILTYLRSSSIGTYAMCPQKYLFTYLLGMKDKDNGKAIMGSTMHKNLELLGKQKIAQQNKKRSFVDEEFGKKHQFQTSVRGLKLRGVFPTHEEAELRCKLLRELDPNHDVFLGEVGIWLPFHPEAYKTGRVEYLEEELNQLMHEKRKNETNATMEFDKRVLETKKKAMEDNIKKAKASGNVLTQTINEDGNLVNVKDINVADKQSNKSVDIDELRRELFEGDNIVMDRR